jgi:two-component system LytT family sensor kinase
MLLQMLVENGVKHGIEKRPQGGKIRICSWLDNGTLNIAVSNSGQLSHESTSTRIGIENAQQRLRLLYGGAAALKFENRAPDSVVAEISIPAESSSR